MWLSKRRHWRFRVAILIIICKCVFNYFTHPLLIFMVKMVENCDFLLPLLVEYNKVINDRESA